MSDLPPPPGPQPSSWPPPPPPPGSAPQDAPPAPGWWKASDGNWYPPQGPGYGYAAPSNGLATAALVLGIIGICLFWTSVLGALLGVLAVIFGAIGMSRARSLPGQPLMGRAKAGLITGVVAVVAGLAFLAWIISEADDLEINSDPPDGFCDMDRFVQDPDC